MSVVIFGGTGSLGTRLVQHFTDKNVDIIVVSRDEQKHHLMREKFPRVKFLLGDIRSKDDLRDAFRDSRGHNPDINLVVNAAALKHVTMGEYNPYQSVQTNILGAKNIIDVCREFRVPTCVFVSTDKAAYPVSLYGMCKGTAERMFVRANDTGPTKFVGVRYGNVVNSNGSLIPMLRRIAPTAGTLYLHNKHMTRFLITLDQAVQVINWACQAPAGTITVPKLPSAWVRDIFALFAEKYGCTIETVGIKPGEKLHELLIVDEERVRTEDHGEYYYVYDDVSGKVDNSLWPTFGGSYSSGTNPMSKDMLARFLESEKLL